jgi:hypothetical protein
MASIAHPWERRVTLSGRFAQRMLGPSRVSRPELQRVQHTALRTRRPSARQMTLGVEGRR